MNDKIPRRKETGGNGHFSRRLRTQLTVFVMLVVSFIMIAVALITFQRIELVLKNQSADNTRQFFYQNEYNIGFRTRETERIAEILMVYRQLNRYFGYGWQGNYDSIEMVSDIFNYSSQIMNSHEYIYSVYYYSEGTAMLGLSARERRIFQEPSYIGKIKSMLLNRPDHIAGQTYWYGGFSSDDFLEDDTHMLYSGSNVNFITAVRKFETGDKKDAYLIINLYEDAISGVFTKSDESDQRTSYLLDNSGKVISHASPQQIGQQFFLEMSELLSEEQNSFIRDDLQLNYYHIQDKDWYLVTEIPLHILYRDIASLRTWFIAVFAGAVVIALFLTNYWIFYATKPLDRLRVAMKKMESGELGGQLEESSRNELGILGSQFNKMSVSMKNLIAQVRQVEQEKRILEKEALQAQINPHFLYNTLNNIKYLAIIEQSDTIAQSITTLGNLLRPVYRSESDFWSIREEIDYMKNYMMIINLRFSGNIRVDYRISEEQMDRHVMKFMLQPIFENAVNHGFQCGEGIITVSEETLDTCFLLHVTDNGTGIDTEKLDWMNERLIHANDQPYLPSKNVGLINVCKRMQVFFGQQYGIRLTSKAGEFTRVTFYFPITFSEREE